jgi:hypothetical protein
MDNKKEHEIDKSVKIQLSQLHKEIKEETDRSIMKFFNQKTMIRNLVGENHEPFRTISEFLEDFYKRTN